MPTRAPRGASPTVCLTFDLDRRTNVQKRQIKTYERNQIPYLTSLQTVRINCDVSHNTSCYMLYCKIGYCLEISLLNMAGIENENFSI